MSRISEKEKKLKNKRSTKKYNFLKQKTMFSVMKNTVKIVKSRLEV